MEKGSFLTVSIKDTGIGMNPDYLPHIFTAFTQEEEGYKRKFDGNGLGLSVVKQYCEINDISISVKSEKHLGSIFFLTFALQK